MFGSIEDDQITFHILSFLNGKSIGTCAVVCQKSCRLSNSFALSSFIQMTIKLKWSINDPPRNPIWNWSDVNIPRIYVVGGNEENRLDYAEALVRLINVPRCSLHVAQEGSSVFPWNITKVAKNRGIGFQKNSRI